MYDKWAQIVADTIKKHEPQFLENARMFNELVDRQNRKHESIYTLRLIYKRKGWEIKRND